MIGSLQSQIEDHPRIRGENTDPELPHPGTAGSPPHTRGKSAASSSCVIPSRITPAYAGKIVVPLAQKAIEADHPRIRGENSRTYSPPSSVIGSPPHTRGKFFVAEGESLEIRITPAYAGKIPPASGSTAERADHPRIRGENPSKILDSKIGKGSPPHTRGK